MAEAYKFNDKQRALLDELLDPQYAAMWAMLLGGYTPGSGEILQGDSAWAGTDIFAWPMQPGYRISSKYGYRPDPFTGEIKFHPNAAFCTPQCKNQHNVYKSKAKKAERGGEHQQGKMG